MLLSMNCRKKAAQRMGRMWQSNLRTTLRSLISSASGPHCDGDLRESGVWLSGESNISLVLPSAWDFSLIVKDGEGGGVKENGSCKGVDRPATDVYKRLA